MSKKVNKNTGKGGLDGLVNVAINGQSYARVTINPRNYRDNPQLYGRYLTKVQKFLAESYKGADVISKEWFEFELKNPKNQNYTIDALLDPTTRKVVAVVSHGVEDVPKSPGTTELVADGENQFTSIYYARSRGGGKYTTSKKYEPELQWLLEHAMISGQKYSTSKGKVNVGLTTVDARHKRVLGNLTANYGGGYLPFEVGVPSLSDDVKKDYDKRNFNEDHKEKLLVIPSGKWTKSRLINVWAKELDEEYNHKKPGQIGYKPLTTAPYFRDFVENVHKMPGRNVTFRPI